jgi:hypothetical protein
VKQFRMSVATRTPMASKTFCCRKPVLFDRFVALDFSFTLNKPVLCPVSVQMHVNLVFRMRIVQKLPNQHEGVR